MTVILNHRDDVNLDTLKRVAREREKVELGVVAIARMTLARETFLGLVEKEPERHIYGVTNRKPQGSGCRN